MNKERVAAVGSFDGMHKGHKAVLSKVKEISSEMDLQPVAITFDRHPLSLISPERTPRLLTTLNEKQRLIRRLGIEPIVVIFDQELRQTTAAEWIRYLKENLNVSYLVVGYDNTFGSDGVNYSIADIKRLGEETGVKVSEAPRIDGISSSRIRKAVSSGDMEEANKMLGRNFILSGKIIRGNGIGHNIGFPTANVSVSPDMATPADGVYAAAAIMPDGKRLPAMVNIGVRPTVKRGNGRVIEANIIGWNGDLYGRDLTLEFIEFMRPEKEFKGIGELRRQLEEDRERALKIINDGNN